MKKLLFFFLMSTTFVFSQHKNCEYDIEEKTDSTSFKSLKQKLVYERVFGNSKDFIQFTLINNNNIPILEIQYLQKSNNFLSAFCFNEKSKIIFQLENGKIVTLLSNGEDVCSTLGYYDNEKSNIRVLTGYFLFTKTNYEELKKSPVSIMRIQFVGESKDYLLKNEIQSELLNETFHPNQIFMDYLRCVE